MTNRVALVTGASRGIGRAIAERLAAEGYSLTITARREPALAAVARDLRAGGATVDDVVSNMAVEDDVHALAERHRDRFGSLDLLVLNAGMGAEGRIIDLTAKNYDLVMHVNLRAQFLLVQALLPTLRASAAATPERGGKIVALASLTGVASEVDLGVYGASKAALISLCESLTLEESSYGVTAHAVSPGYVDTELISAKRDGLAEEGMLTSDDVAELVMGISRLSARAVVPNLVLTRAGERIWRA